MSYQSVLDFQSDSKFKDLQTSGITSREQIINPYELVNIADYRNTRTGRRQYEADLARAIQIMEMQQASYDEWYESESQQVSRQKAAGLNPDLIGIEPGEASEISSPGIVPGQNIPTDGEAVMNGLNTAFNAIGSVASVFSTVSGVMNAVSSMKLANQNVKQSQAATKLLEQQSDGQFLSNIGSFVKTAQGSISDKLARAINSSQDFNIDDFFAGDFSDVYTPILPSDDPRYMDAFNSVLSNSQQIHSDAYKRLASTEEGRKQYLSQLASGYYSDDDDEMTGQLAIAVQLDEELSRVAADTAIEIKKVVKEYVNAIDVQQAAESFNLTNEYNADYYSALDGKVMAVYDEGLRRAAYLQAKATSDVYSYLHRQFKSPINIFLPQRKQRVGWQILSGATMGWQDHFAATSDKYFGDIMAQYRANVELMKANAQSSIMNAESNRMNAETNRMNFNLNERRFSHQINKDSNDAIWKAVDVILPF